MAKRYINVAYKDREMAKQLGARWDASVKRWYCPPDSALAKVYSWRKADSRPLPVTAFGEPIDDTKASPETLARNMPPRVKPALRPATQLSFLN
jgi:hypothetical protein